MLMHQPASTLSETILDKETWASESELLPQPTMPSALNLAQVDTLTSLYNHAYHLSHKMWEPSCSPNLVTQSMQTSLSHGVHLLEELKSPVTQSNFQAASTVFIKVPPDHAHNWILTNSLALSLTVNCKPIHSVLPLVHRSGLKSLQAIQKDPLLPSLLMVPKSMQAQALSPASRR